MLPLLALLLGIHVGNKEWEHRWEGVIPQAPLCFHTYLVCLDDVARLRAISALSTFKAQQLEEVVKEAEDVARWWASAAMIRSGGCFFRDGIEVENKREALRLISQRPWHKTFPLSWR